MWSSPERDLLGKASCAGVAVSGSSDLGSGNVASSFRTARNNGGRSFRVLDVGDSTGGRPNWGSIVAPLKIFLNAPLNSLDLSM